jgi:YfiH family protein
VSEFTWKRRNGIPFLTINSFSSHSFVINAFTTRHGGVSTGTCSTLNMSWMVGDEPGNVLTNRSNICHALGADLDNAVAAQQVHGDRVAVLSADDRGKGARGMKDALEGVDAMITREQGIMLITCHADCVPVFLLDPVRRVIGLVHAGWKGTALQVAGKTVRKMQEVFGTRPRDCLAG